MQTCDGSPANLLHSGATFQPSEVLHSGAIQPSDECYTVRQEPLGEPFPNNARYCVTPERSLDARHCVTTTDEEFSQQRSHCVTGPENEGVLADRALFRLARRWKGRGVSVNDPNLRSLFDAWLLSRQGRDLKASLDFLGDSKRVFGIFQTKWCFVKKPVAGDAHEQSWIASERSVDSPQLATIQNDFIRRIGRWMRDLQQLVGENETIWLSTPTITEKLGGDRMSAWRALNRLEFLGLIRRKHKNQKPSPHRATEYLYVGAE